MKILRKILIPFSLLYGVILKLRNFAYDRSWFFSSTSFNLPIICVGNLSLGGTGKSPTIEYLIRLLKNNYTVATLSRGYGRKTTGFLEVQNHHSAMQVGDEPLQFKNKFPTIKVAVDEQRVRGINQLLDSSQIDVILLDDAYQHRKVKPGIHILLTVYNDLYCDDWVLPAGNLREPASGANRAELILVTKCPPLLSIEKQQSVFRKLKLHPHQSLFFSYIDYAKSVFSKNEEKCLADLKDFTLVTGIAKPKPLLNFLNEVNPPKNHIAFPDHHNFTEKEIAQLKLHHIILTTEKDFARLKDFLLPSQLYYIPIEMKIINQQNAFNELILNYVAKSSSQITNN